jgi:hypothetical protein
MVARILTEPLRLRAALHTAAYMRWVEVRKGASPSAHDTQRFIQGLLDVDRISYEPDEPQMIEILALALDLDRVHAFIRDTGFFETLDRGTRGHKK